MYQSAECLTCGYYKLWEEDWTRKLSTDHQQEEEDWQTSGLHIQEVQAVKGTKTACWIIEFIWYQCFNFLYLDFLHQKLLEIHFEKDTIQRTTKNSEYHQLRISQLMIVSWLSGQDWTCKSNDSTPYWDKNIPSHFYLLFSFASHHLNEYNTKESQSGFRNLLGRKILDHSMPTALETTLDAPLK